MNKFELDKLSSICKKNNLLFNVMFVLLSECNHRCIHCYIPEHCTPGLTTKEIFANIDQARELGALNVTLTGGEIFLRKDLLDIIEYSRKKHMRVFLMSNATLVDEKMAEKLADLHISGFSTTIFSMNEDIHDEVTQVKGSLKRTLKALDLMNSYNINITVKCPLMEINKYGYRDVEKYAREHGYDFMTTATIFCKTDGDDSPHNLEIKEDFPKILEEIDELTKRYSPDNFKDDIDLDGIPCSAGYSNICINYDGTVWPCNTLTLDCGNVKKDSLSNIWKNSKELNEWRVKGKEKLKVCENCKLKKKCIRCPGLAYMENNDLYGCSSSAKRLAINRRKEVK